MHISKRNFWWVICIAKDLIWTILNAISQYFDFFVTSDSRFSNSCISAEYCPILINIHQWKAYSASKCCINLNFKKLTIVTGFVVQGHIWEWFLKGHVTLNTGVMMLKFKLCNHRQLCFRIYWSIWVILSCNDIHNITVFTVFVFKYMQPWSILNSII